MGPILPLNGRTPAKPVRFSINDVPLVLGIPRSISVHRLQEFDPASADYFGAYP